MSNAIRRMAAQAVPTSEELERASTDHAVGLARILAEPRLATTQRRASRVWAPLLVAAAATAALVVGLQVVSPAPEISTPTYQATPVLLTYQTEATMPTDPSELLQLLAEHAATQPPVRGTGPYDYVRTQGWYLDVLTSDTGTTGRVNPTNRDQWIAADGSGRLEETRSGERTDTSGEYAAGELSRPMTLSSDPTVLAAQIAPPFGRDTAAWFDAVNAVWNRHPVEPPVQAALLRVLAARPDMKVLGGVTDRVGRMGVAIGTTSSEQGLPTEHTLILDPITGALLGYEQVVLEVGDLPLQSAPATVSYTVWLDSARVDTTSTRP